MLKKLLAPFLVVFILFLSLPIVYLSNYSQTITLNQEQTVYELPYPGILPDHPLYFVKSIRDKILDFTTQDKLKKVELYINFSDKRAKMAQNLSEKGKIDLAITTMSKSEKYFMKVPKLLKDSKAQGVSASQELYDKAKGSNNKHKEIIKTLLESAPEGEQSRITEILKINETSEKQLADSK